MFARNAGPAETTGTSGSRSKTVDRTMNLVVAGVDLTDNTDQRNNRQSRSIRRQWWTFSINLAPTKRPWPRGR